MKTTYIVAVFAILILFGCANQIVGNDRDSHGCIGSAGYSWCEAKHKCLRTWEESCTPMAGNDKEVNGTKSGMPNLNKTRFYCNSNSDCVSTCGSGCVNNEWAKNYRDTCQNVRAWFCTCVNNVCNTDGHPPNRCGPCPQLVSAPPDFCKDGKIIPPLMDDCGCYGPPECDMAR